MDCINLVNECVECDVCVKECAFLQKYGNPKQIAKGFFEESQDGSNAYECSLCSLCTSVCPKGLDPSKAFLEMRTKVYANTGKVLKKHKGIMAYEKRGLSKRYSLYKIPEKCKTVFFPGCTFAGTRAKRTEQTFSWLKKIIPDIAIVLACCSKPSHDLGRKDFFDKNFSMLESYFVKNGVEKIITACPNCYKVFSRYFKGLKTVSVYEILAKQNFITDKRISGCVTIHDPCVTRFRTDIHDSVRKLIEKSGLKVKEMEHCRQKTICCGEGGSVFSVAPEFASNWQRIRKKEAGNNRIITYCAGCCNLLGKSVQTDHILDLLFEPEKTMNCSVKKTTSPFTYLSRINLKKKLAKQKETL